MPARLVPLTTGREPIVLLQRPVILIGRHSECDVRLDLPQISRRHCCVGLAYNRLLIRDLGSRNGVRVNGRLVDESPLRAGDEVAIGPLIYRLEEESLPPPTSAKPAKPAVRAPEPAPQSLPDLPMPVGGDDSELIPLDDLV